MNNIIKITKLEFGTLFNVQLISCTAVLLLHILISFTVLKLVDTSGPAGVGDFIALFWILIMGLLFFAASFKYTLSLGISRKRFFWAGNLSMVILAVVMTVIVAVFYFINLKVANVWMMYSLIYQNRDFAGLIIWEFAALISLGMLGWLIRLIYYISNRQIKIVVSIVPFVLASLLFLFNALFDGIIGRALLSFVKFAMGLSGQEPDPYTGALSFLVAAVIMGGIIFLLLRRAQVND